MPYIDRVSFIAGLVVGLIFAWALSQVTGWLRGVFKPPDDKSLGQKVTSGLRKLVASLLVLLTLVAMGYIVYTIVFK
jgi:predicted PurR-regulated permease PerM